ncbi:MAG: hypothetical protein BWY98_00631 [Tenericutes bacterium ADurb.BinA155]|nr:MAG: hypothetical protein BWY98_00631 [Tenericutes bacterium ADurb.BinA155]
MIYCHKCAKKVKDDVSVCPNCGETIVSPLKDEEVRPLVQTLHKRSNYYRNWVDRGLSYIVIGSTLLIIGVIFYFLSFQTVSSAEGQGQVLVLNKSTSEFWVFLVGVISGGTLLIVGSAFAIGFGLARRIIRRDVELIRANKSSQVPPIYGMKKPTPSSSKNSAGK